MEKKLNRPPPTFADRDLEYAAAFVRLHILVEKIEAEVERMRARLLERWLELYYATEELTRDPAHTHLIPWLAKIRTLYDRRCGRPIPRRGEG